MRLNLIISFLLISAISFAQSSERVLEEIGKNPIYYIDNIKVSKNEFRGFNPEEVASVSVYSRKEAIELMGEDGKDGVIYVESKKFSKKRFWNYFISKSSEYLKIVPNPEDDVKIQYILNKKVLSADYEGKLARIDDKTFNKINILSKKELIKKYNIEDKDFGVEIFSTAPKD